MATLSVRQLGRGVDLVLLTVTILLTLIGLGAVFSTSLNTATPSYAIFYRQAIFAAAGFALVIVFARLDYRSFGAAHWVLYGAALVSLVAVRLFGKTVNGTTGWFEVAGMQLQPVEFVKIIVCLVLAKYFSDHADETGSWKFVLMSGLIVAAPVLLVMIQPDFGSAMLMIAIWFGLLLAVPVPRRRLALLVAAAIVAAVASWFFVFQTYQKERILNFVSPGRDPLKSGYNVTQAITAIGSGQWFGRGLGLGPQSQLSFLPERQTDFIFASIGEELGFVGTATIVAFFSALLWRCYVMSRRSRDNFSVILSLGIGLMFFVQVAINIGMNIGVFPVTGIPLPFISYGGSSLLSSFIAVGILESLASRQRILPL